jgi:hypothetical protein
VRRLLLLVFFVVDESGSVWPTAKTGNSNKKASASKASIEVLSKGRLMVPPFALPKFGARQKVCGGCRGHYL